MLWAIQSCFLLPLLQNRHHNIVPSTHPKAPSTSRQLAPPNKGPASPSLIRDVVDTRALETDLTETVEESGPVVYSDGEEEEREGEGGLRDVDMEDLAYEGDPLLYSDCEGEGMLYT